MTKRVFRISAIVRFSSTVNPAGDFFAFLETSRCAGFRHDTDELFAEDRGGVGVVFALEDVEFAEAGGEAFAAAKFGTVEAGGVDADEDPIGGGELWGRVKH